MAKCMMCGGSQKTTKVLPKKMAKGGSNQSMGIYGIPQEVTGTSGQYGLMKKGGTKGGDPTLVKHSCPPGLVRLENGKCGTRETPFKKGGSVKNAKLAAMAPPKNKITRADIITAAKKNARKKK